MASNRRFIHSIKCAGKYLLHPHRRGRWIAKSRSVVTWSPLASAFNLKTKWKINFGKSNVGLFEMPELTSPTGFSEAQVKCIKEAEDLVQEAINSPTSPQIVNIFDKLSDTLCRVADLADFIRLAHPDNNFAQAAEDACMSISALVERLNTNVELHQSIRRLLDSKEVMGSMDEESRKVAELFLFDFEQSGIHLDEIKRLKAVSLNEDILVLGSQFMQGTQMPTAVRKDELPEHIRHCFPVDGQNVMINSLHAENPSDLIREAAYKVFLYPNPTQSTLLDQLLEARHSLANLVGFQTFAHRTLRGTMAKTPENVMEFLMYLAEHLYPKAKKELQFLEGVKKSINKYNNQEIKQWDPSYYMNIAKKQKFDVENIDLTHYFSLGACMDGLNLIFTSLYGVSLESVDPQHGETWAQDVKKLAVIHETEGLLGYIYCDFFDRPSKPPHDCHFTIRGGRLMDDESYQLPRVVLVCSCIPPQSGAPALLTHGMMENLFHEFGHGIHSMLARTKFQHVTGTRCATDFAEVPSILMEFFANDYRVLKKFAKHYKTQETLPEEMISKLCASKKMFSAYEMQTQVYYSILDQMFHGNHPLQKSTTDILADVQNNFSCLSHVPGTAWQLRFGHLVGYGAKYYSYVLSKAVATKIWSQCFAQDPFSRSAGERFRKEMLASGGGKDPATLVENMLGHKPTKEELVQSLLTGL
ncbi:mitochondrial intermediate peptidase-like [Anneissia japonica]|uniref:mitochondrial intermediate peptidase-like n=1 Tax=Anneissia japonica TaxID=1529436 RepID=UPI001425AEA5|nr:mitochondrial intermediate peptidase-like [Anneissia japonica]XP_033096111.1 mitochondrial intermediate peptidase-like [Anneissia japonica]XP_033096112.1 mitochondrial intermediate peptidase-like [Anneissia japonica]XP_033096114.1 mitochondrial intermediate peptidase-like [Anneissia japonica]XP_033096115.1 mitochondrial intermediate peptidase-like [Anneissia japonica]